MKKLIEDNLATIIFSLPEKSLRFWVLNVVIQAIQLMEPGAYLFSRIHPQSLLCSFLKVTLGIFTLRPATEGFPAFSIVVQVLYWLYTALLMSQLFSGQPRVSSLLVYAQIWCPIVVSVSIESLRYYHVTALSVLSALTIISSTFVWALRVLVIKQDYLSCNAKLSSIKSILRLVLFMVQSVLVFFPPTEKNLMSLVGVSLGLSLMMLALSTSIFQSVDEELEYLHYLKCLFVATFYIGILLVIHTPQTQYMLVLTPVTLVVLERFQALKFLFQVKYNFLLERIVKKHSQEDLIVMLELLGTDRTTIYGKPGVHRGRKQNYWTNKSIGFGFYVKARCVCIRLAIKKSNQNGRDITVGQLMNEETYTLIQSIMQQRIDYKSNLIPIVLSYQFLKRDLLVTALSIQASIQDGSNFNTRVLKKVLKMRICHAFAIKDRIGSPYKISEGFCCLGTSVVSSKIAEVIRTQKFFERFLNKLIHLSQQTSLLTSKLTNRIISSNETIQIMLAHSASKVQIQKMIDSMDNIVTKQFVVCLYIYHKYFCSQKFSVFQSLNNHMNTLETIQLCPSAYDMVCLVSAAQNNMGRILTASTNMVEFFKMDFQHINKGLVHIEEILPAPLAQIHNQLILKFFKTGVSKIVSKENEFYLVRENTAYPVEFRVKCQPLQEGINFSSQFKVVEKKNFILFNKDNQILGFSQNAKQLLPKNILECRLIHQVFNCLKKSNTTSLQNGDMISSSNRNTLSDPQFNVHIKYYTSVDFEMGICEFNRKQTIEFSNSSHQEYNRMTKQSQNCQVESVPLEVNQQFLKSQTGITTMSLNTRKFTGITILLSTYGIILLISTFLFYMFLIGMVSRSQNITKFTSNFYDNNLDGICLTLDRIHRLRHAINIGDYPANQTIQGINMSAYLIRQAQVQLDGLNKYIKKLLDAVKTVPAEFVQILNRRQIQFSILSETILPMSTITFMSTLLSYHSQINSLTKPDFQNEWEQIVSEMDSLADTALQYMGKTVRIPISEQVKKFSQNSILQSKLCLIVVGTVTLLAVAMISVILRRVFREKIKYLQLLLQLDEGFFRQKLETNRNIATLLRQTAKSSLSNVQIDRQNQTIEFTSLGHLKKFSREYTEVVDPNGMNEHQNLALKPNSKFKKSLDNQSLSRRSYWYLAVAVLTLMPAACLMAVAYFRTCNQTLSVEDFYQKFIQSSTQVYISATSILNINTLSIINSPKNKFMNISTRHFFDQAVSKINMRETDSILIGFIPQMSGDYSITKLIEDHLYLSKCSDNNDNACKQILSGSLTRGLPSALLAFTTSATSLYYSLLASTFPYSSYFHSIMQSLLQVYRFYLRDLIKTGQFALSLANSVYQTNLCYLTLLLYLSLLVQALMLALIIRFVSRSCKQVHQLKKQIFTIFPVDILLTNINLEFQIRIQVESE